MGRGDRCGRSPCLEPGGQIAIHEARQSLHVAGIVVDEEPPVLRLHLDRCPRPVAKPTQRTPHLVRQNVAEQARRRAGDSLERPGPRHARLVVAAREIERNVVTNAEQAVGASNHALGTRREIIVQEDPYSSPGKRVQESSDLLGAHTELEERIQGGRAVLVPARPHTAGPPRRRTRPRGSSSRCAVRMPDRPKEHDCTAAGRSPTFV
jgi:hypothetical protein